MSLLTARRLGSAHLLAAGIAVAALGGFAGAAERPWLEVKTPQFVIVANTGEKAARDMGWQFEQVRHVFQTVWPWARRESGRPFVVFVVRSEADLKALAPEYWEGGRDGTSGVAVNGVDKDYVALLNGVALPDNLQTNPYFYAYWGYAIGVLNATFPVTLPHWYRRGLADLFGNTLLRQKDISLGIPIRHHIQRLGERVRIPLSEVLAADRNSKYVTDEAWRPMFDAEAWMLVHYLVFGDKQAHLPQFNRYSSLLLQGNKPEVAFREALGEVEPLARSFEFYIGRQLYTYARYQTDLDVKAEGFAVRTLDPAAAAALRAGFHVAMDRPREARALIDEARRSEPSSVLATEVEALLLDREGKRDEALAAFDRAAEGGTENFYVHYRRASLLDGPQASRDTRAQARKSLEQAVKLNPDHAWSEASLARALAELEPGDRAVEAARKAVSLAPSVGAHRVALVQALWTASRQAEARQEAQAALKLADDQSRTSVQEWIDFMGRPEASSPRTASRPLPEDRIPEITKACEAGTAGACAALASAYERGAGVAKDAARALTLFERACDLGELRACAYAARLKFQGFDAKDVEGATRLASRACEGGALDGCTVLALIHLGRSTPQDIGRARELLTRGCDGGEANACALLKSIPK